MCIGKIIKLLALAIPTCMPHILHPDVSACCEEQPLNWYEEVTKHVRSHCDADKKEGEPLKSICTGKIFVFN